MAKIRYKSGGGMMSKGGQLSVDTSDFEAKMASLKEQIPEQAGQGIEMAAKEMRDEAKANAPVKTGYLRDHIGYYTLGKPTTQAIVESTAFYSQFQEYGTRYMAGRYFMRNAMMTVLPRCPEYVRDAITSKTYGVGMA